MAQYDGSIRINTEINAKNAESQLSSLENRMTKTADKIASLRSKMESLKDVKIPTQEYTEVQKQIEATEKKINDLVARQEKFLATGGKESSSAFQRMQYDLDELRNSMPYLKGELQDLVETGKAFTLGKDTEKYSKLSQQLKNAENEMEVLNQKHDIQSLKVEKAESEYKRLGSSAKNSLKKIGSVIKNSAITSMQMLGNVTKKVGTAIKGVISKLLSMGKNAKSASSGISGMATGFKNMLKYALGFEGLFSLINKIKTAIKEGMGNLAQYSAPVNASLSSLKSSLTQLKNSLATAFAPILTAVAPALTVLINMVSKAVTAVGMLIAALTGQKTFVKAKAVQEDYAASLGETAGAAKKAGKEAKKAVKALAGFDKLNVLGKNDSDVAGSGGGGGGDGGANIGDMFETVDIPSQISDLAEVIKKAWKDADFTEIGALIGEKLKGALEGIPWDSIQETAEKVGKSLATLINGFVEVSGLGDMIGKTIAEAINTGLVLFESFAANLHWDRVGAFIANGINGALENIDWETALSAASLFGSGLANLLNNALTPEVFSNIGNTIGMGINTALTFANSFLETFDWSAFGSNIATGLNSAINTIDWNLLGTTIGNALNAFFDTLGGFADKFDWSGFGLKVGTALSTAISTFDWANAGTSVAKFINGLFKSIKSFFDNTDWKSLGKGITTAISGFFSEFDWGTVSGTISSFLIGLLDFFIGLIQGIDWSEVPQGIVDSISKFFKNFDYKGVFGKFGELVGTAVAAGIDLLKALKDVLAKAWDKVVKYFKKYIKDSGGNIIEGLFNGILDALKSIGNWIKKNIFDPFIKGFKSAFGIHSPSKVLAEQGSYIISGLLKGLEDNISSVLDWLKNIPEWFKEKFSDAYKAAKDAFSNIGKWFGERWEDIKSVFTSGDGITGWFKSKFDGAYKKVTSAFSDIGTWFSDRWDDIKDVFTIGNGVSGWFKSKFDGAYGKVTSAFSDVSKFFENVWKNIKSPFSNIASWFEDKFSKAWKAVKKVFSSGGKVFSGIKNGILSGLKTVINALINGINKVIKIPFDGINTALNKLKNISIVGKKPFGFLPTISVPQIPQLANGAVIRGGDPFMAVLGDQPRGQTNIEAPLDTIKRANKAAVLEALSELGVTAGSSRNSGNEAFVFQVDGKTFFEITRREAQQYFGRTGRSPFPI